MKIQSIVFTYAWKIRKEEKNIKNALREAWKRVKLAFRLLNDDRSNLSTFSEAYRQAAFCSKLRRAMKAGKVRFCYKKIGQTEGFETRTGTALTPKRQARKTNKVRKPSATAYYFDIGRNGSRSFRIENLIVEQGFQKV